MKEYIKKNKQVYNEMARAYEYRRENKSEYSETTEYLGNSVLKYLSNIQNKKVLEIGPGAGQILKYYEDNGLRTVGVELSEEMCKLCSEQAPNSIILNDNICDLNFIPNQFDIVYMGAIIHLFPLEDAKILLEKVFLWLKDDGYIFINTTCHDKSIEGYFEKKDYLNSNKRFRRYWNEQDFENFILSYGFKIQEKIYTDERDRNKKWVAIIAQKYSK